MFTIDRAEEINSRVVVKYIQRHRGLIPRYEKLARYYAGEHDILSRTKGKNLANNRIVCNHAKYITDTSVGYLVGNPVGYNGRDGADITDLQDWLRLADSDTQDMDLSKDASVFGKTCELVYMSNDSSPTPRLACFDPRQAFVVYDDTVEHRPVFGVYYYPQYNDDGALSGYTCKWYTDTTQTEADLTTGFSVLSEGNPESNPFGEVPLIEYYNNEECQGDFEQVISLIDAYNILQSDRVNDKQQFVEAILLIKGQILGDDAEEESETYQRLKEYGLLMLDTDSSAEWLTRTFDENSVEVLCKSLEKDIHKFSGVPCMSDENFVGNASGVAMKYKLLGFEQITKIKERYFRAGLKTRLRLFTRMMELKGKGKLDPESIDIVFQRNLPANEVELAQVVSMLSGLVPDEILLSILPFVPDASAAADEIKREKEEAARRQQASFTAAANTPPEDMIEDEE